MRIQHEKIGSRLSPTLARLAAPASFLVLVSGLAACSDAGPTDDPTEVAADAKKGDPSPHFTTASAKLQGTNLLVSFKEAGLGNNQLITYVASANATATYVCVNKGGGNPSAQNKTTVNGPVSTTGTFNSGKNGQVNASLTLTPPGPGTFSCPSGQSLEVAEVTYTNVTIEDMTNSVTTSIGGTFDTGCLLPNVRGACS